MKMERTKNASRNIFFGIILKVYQVLVPFAMRTAMIYFMGVQYLGLNGLFTSILQVLNLAELGVGSAMVFSMYEPVAEDDNVTICALLKLYKTYYSVIGSVIAIIGIAVTPLIPQLISGDAPAGMNIYILYLLNLGATVLSYWMFAYKSSILQVFQRNDIISKVQLVTGSVQYLLQFLVLWLFRNYYLYVIVMLVTQTANNIITANVTSRFYPQYRPEGKLDSSEIKVIRQRIKDLFTSKIGSVVVNSADTIVISAFLGLTVLAVYQNYYFILTAIIGFIEVIFSACTAGIGNSLVTESKEKNFNDLKVFTFIIAWIAGFCTCCLLNLYQPFMKAWVGEGLMLDFTAVVCFCIYFMIYEINRVLNTYKDAAGIWHKDRFRPLVTAMGNLGMNLVLVQFLGIYGVLLSTVLSTICVGMPWLLQNLFEEIFEKKNLGSYLKQLVAYIGVVFLVCVICYEICRFLCFSTVATIVVRLLVCCVVPNILFWTFYHRTEVFSDSLKLVRRIVGRKQNE